MVPCNGVDLFPRRDDEFMRLDTEPAELVSRMAADDVIDLQRCGVRYDYEFDSFDAI